MAKLIRELLGRPFRAPDDGGGGKAASDAGNQAGGAGGGNAGTHPLGNAGDQAGNERKAAKPSAADIAARNSGAFAPKPAAKAGDEGDAGDGVDPATKPKGHVNGDGRPEHVPAKFWDGRDRKIKVDDVLKAYSTLETNFTRLKEEKGDLTPGEKAEDYLVDFAVPKDHPLDRIREFDAKNDPALNAFRDVAHEFKLPLAIAGPLALKFLEKINGHIPAPRTEADIIKDLGDGGEALRDALGVWMSGQYENGIWSEDEFEYALQAFGQDARGIRLLGKIREASGEKPIPLGRPVGGSKWSEEEYYAAHRDKRYGKDPAFTAEVERQGEEIFGTDLDKSSHAGVGVPPPLPFDRRAMAVTRG